MNYGTTTYGSTAIGGQGASEWFTFFPDQLRDAGVLFERELELSNPGGFFSIFTQQGSEAAENRSGVVYTMYTRNAEGETPQFSGILEGNGQFVVAATRFIKVTTYIDPEIWASQFFSVRGRRGD